MTQEFKYTFEFFATDVKKKVGCTIMSPITRFDGCEWQLQVDIQDSLKTHLACLTTKRNSRRVPSEVRFSVLKEDESEMKSHSLYAVYGMLFPSSYGCNYPVKKAELFNPAAGYTKNNAMTFKVEVNTFHSKFGDPSLNESFWAPFYDINKDVTLNVGGQQIKAHRLILAQGCPYLRSLLYPNESKEIVLSNCDYKATLTVVRFIYTQKCVVDPNNLREVLLIGEKFGLKKLVLSCFELLSPENAASFASVVDGMFNQVLRHFFWQYASENLVTILDSQVFWSLTHDEIISFIEKEQIESIATASQLLSVRKKIMKRQKNIEKSASVPTKDSLLCVICQDNVANTLVIPCNHLCLCSEDAATLRRMNTTNCPLCKRTIESTTKVYLP